MNFGGQVVQASTVADTEAIGVIVAFIILLIGFASFVAALVPLVAAIAGVAVTDLAILALTSVVSETNTTAVLAVMVGLAVGIDYSLLIMNRYRQELIEGKTPQDAAAFAGGTAGTAVCVAGMTVFVAMVALAIVQIPFLTVMGLCAGGAVVLAVTAAQTLVPALLSLSGVAPGHRATSQPAARSPREARLRVHVAPLRAASLPPASAGAAGRRDPAPSRGGACVAHPPRPARRRCAADEPDHAARLRPHFGGLRTRDQRPAHRRRARAGGFTKTQTEALDSYFQKVKAHPLPDVASIGQPVANPDHDLVVVEVVPKTGPNAPATGQLINSINQVAAQGQKQYGLQTYVTGQTALNIDISSKLSSVLPLYLTVIVILCVILLFILFRSVVVPIKAVLGYVLSVLAALGAVTFVFQDGHLSGVFGVAAVGPILSFLPILLIGGLFGLAMDYEVFLVSRMREEYGRSNDARSAVMDGYTHSAKVVTSAAIIMISVFASFIFTPDPVTKSLGFCLAVGVLIDAFIVRMTMVPAAMALFGRTAWWLPKSLQRVLPDLDIEGTRLVVPTSAAAATAPTAATP